MLVPDKAEVVICGAGIVGLTIARELVARGRSDIVLLEKEHEIGKHASGRNSGVLHAGIYYPAGTLKAKLCLRGNRLMKAYCREKKLPLLETGKAVVAKNDAEREVLRELHHRGTTNGANVELIDEARLAEIEPYAKTCKDALHVHDTAMVDPKAVLRSLTDDLLGSHKVRILTDVGFVSVQGSRTVRTTHGAVRFETFINTAGAYSDRVAHRCGVAHDYRLIPFKGTYKKLRADRVDMVRGNIYPVPDLKNPFLGVHFTRSVHGDAYIGPTAIPAFAREHYGLFSGLGLESPRILFDDFILLLRNAKFRAVAKTEPFRYIPQNFFREAQALVKGLKPADLESCTKSGIRPQLVNWKTKELVMDFLVVKDQERIHVLNAISPAFTSSMAFAEYLVSTYLAQP